MEFWIPGSDLAQAQWRNVLGLLCIRPLCPLQEDRAHTARSACLQLLPPRSLSNIQSLLLSLLWDLEPTGGAGRAPRRWSRAVRPTPCPLRVPSLLPGLQPAAQAGFPAMSHCRAGVETRS